MGAVRIARGVVAVLLALAVAAHGAPSAVAEDPPPDERPNIVFIMTDDQEAASVAYMPKVQQLLAAEGMSFTNALVNLPLCCPARATVLRGQGAIKTGIWNNVPPNGGFADFYNAGMDDETVGVWMDRAGYRTGFVGKYLNGYPNQVSGLALDYRPPGWDTWFGLYGSVQQPYDYSVNHDGSLSTGGIYNTDRLTDAATSFIADPSDDPFFLMVFETAPHTPLIPEPEYEGLFTGLEAPRVPSYNEADMSDKPEYADTPLRPPAWQAGFDEQYRNRLRELRSVDDMVEDVVDALDAAGELDNTYIVFTSDNGYLIGQHRQFGKVFPYEEAINVPLIVRGPGVPAGSINDDLVGNIDFAPTFVDLAGGSIPIEIDGHSFAGIVSTDHPPPPTWRSSFYVSSRLFEVVRTEHTAFIDYPSGNREFYDLRVDPYQIDNAYDTMDQAVLIEMLAALDAFRAGNEPGPPGPLPPVVEAGLDQTLTLPTMSTTLDGLVLDDGLPDPPATLAASWRQVGGPSGAVFDDPAAADTGITFPGVGVYTLELSGDDTETVVTDTVVVTVREPGAVAVMIAGTTSPPAGDRPIADRVTAAGYELTVVDDDSDLAALDPGAIDLLLISTSVSPTKVGGVFADAAVPILTWEGYLLDDLDLSAIATGETTATHNTVTIGDETSPLAAGLTGSPVVTTRRERLSYLRPSPDADVVATVPGSSNNATIVLYEPGDRLISGALAPAPRVVLFPTYEGARRLNDHGLALVDAALAELGGDFPAPPVVYAGADRAIALPTVSLTLAGSASDDGLPSPLRTQWTQTAGPIGVTFDDPSSLAAEATFPGPGDYTLQLAADDGETTVTDAVDITVRGPLAPTVDAGVDRSVRLPTLTVSLAGTATDDGLPDPPGSLTTGWTQTAGPSGVVFDDPSSLAAEATFPGPGNYTLQLAADDGETTVTDTVDITVTESAPHAIFIANRATLPAGDQPVADRVAAAGFEVTVVDDDSDLASLDLGAVDLLVVSTSVSPAKVGAVFADAPVPILTWEGYLLDDLDLSTVSTGETGSAFREVTIADPSHPIAAGLTGPATVTNTPNRLTYGRPGPDASVVATAPGQTTNATVFAYEPGDRLVSGIPAPAARVVVFPTYDGAKELTPAGNAIVDAALAFLGGTFPDPPIPDPQPPTVDAGPDLTVTLPTLAVSLAGMASDDGRPDPPGALVTTWTQTGGPPGVAFDDPSRLEAVVTLPGVGSYTLQLSADDGETIAIDTVDVTVREQGGQVLFIVGSIPLPGGDQPIAARLTAAGLELTLVDDDSNLEALDLGGVDLLVISTSVVPSKVGAVFVDAAVPILTWEGYLLDDLGLASASGEIGSFDRISIADPSHPVAGGLTGNPVVTNARYPLIYGRPGPDADVIATVPGQAAKATVFAYEVGDRLTSGASAPSPRLALFPTYNGARRLSAQGAAVVDAAIAWLIGA